METLTWEQAKQQVAERHVYPSWTLALRRLVYDAHVHNDFEKLLQMQAEAAELYAQAKANEAVKADRNLIRTTCLDSKAVKLPGHEGFYWVFNGQVFQELPLPFPYAK